MDPALIGNALLAATLVASTLAAKWSTQARAQRKEIVRLRKTVELFEDHTYELRRALAHHGHPRPAAPPGLYEEPEEEDQP